MSNESNPTPSEPQSVAGALSQNVMDEAVRQIVAISMAGIDQPLWETRYWETRYKVETEIKKLLSTASNDFKFTPPRYDDIAQEGFEKLELAESVPQVKTADASLDGGARQPNIICDPFGKWWGSLQQSERDVMWGALEHITKAFYAGQNYAFGKAAEALKPFNDADWFRVNEKGDIEAVFTKDEYEKFIWWAARLRQMQGKS